MDFKIGEDIVEEENKEESSSSKDNKKFNLIIIIGSALIVGIIVFLLLNSVLNPKTKTKPSNTQTVTSEKLSLKNENVKVLYQYVTYGTDGIRNDKFVKNEKVTVKDFTDEEIYYYALQFVQVDDFDFTGRYDEENNKIYSLSSRLFKKYVERYFGNNVKYSTDLVITYPFSFSINGKNVGIVKYSEDSSSFEAVFTDTSKEKEYVIEPYMGKLVEAYKEVDGGYKLVEKIIFVKAVKQDDGKYEVTISKDYEGSSIIESSIDQSEEDLKNITIDKYIKKASTITYNFKTNTKNELCFYSSEIK